MSKPVKEMIIRSYREQFADITDAVLVDIRGVEANDTRTFRADLATRDIRVTVVKNNLAKKAFSDGGLAPLGDLLSGPSAVVHGGESVVNVARDLVEWAKKLDDIELKGAIMEGTLFGPDEVERLSKFPTRDEAQAQVVQVILGPAGQLIGAIDSAGGQIAGVLETLVEKLEKGESVQAVG